MNVHFATIQLWSAITGTRPGILIPQNTSLPDGSSLSKRKQNPTFQSDLPEHTPVTELKGRFGLSLKLLDRQPVIGILLNNGTV